MSTRKAKKVNFEHSIVIPVAEVKNAVKNGLLDPMLDKYFKIARFDMLTMIEKKYV